MNATETRPATHGRLLVCLCDTCPNDSDPAHHGFCASCAVMGCKPRSSRCAPLNLVTEAMAKSQPATYDPIDHLTDWTADALHVRAAQTRDARVVAELNRRDPRAARVRSDWWALSGEAMEIRSIGGALYAFGSEVATLRLLKKYRECAKARADFSENLGTFFFSLEVNV